MLRTLRKAQAYSQTWNTSYIAKYIPACDIHLLEAVSHPSRPVNYICWFASKILTRTLVPQLHEPSQSILNLLQPPCSCRGQYHVAVEVGVDLSWTVTSHMTEYA